jgi:hypothetical protein
VRGPHVIEHLGDVKVVHDAVVYVSYCHVPSFMFLVSCLMCYVTHVCAASMSLNTLAT